MTFTNSAALLLLITIPIVLYIGWPKYRFRRVRDSVSILLRAAIMILVVLALAGAQVVQSADKLDVVFLVDVSDSMGTDFSKQLDYIRTAAEQKRTDDEFGIILFGADARPERTLSPVAEVNRFDSQPVTSNTNFAAAINLALGMFTNDAARRIVILSDGVPTTGDALKAAELAAATGVEISYVPFAREPAPEIQVLSVNAPETVTEGQNFDLAVTIDSSEDTTAAINVYSAGNQLFDTDHEIQLRAGTNNFTFSLPALSTGPQSFRVLVKPIQGSDTFEQNNQLATFSNVVGPARVLVVSVTQPGDPNDEAQQIVPALEHAGVLVDRATPATLPVGLQELVQYRSIILTDVPAERLSDAQMQNLETYVRDLGGGLVVVGGPDSYGPGFYMQTPLEEVLPVEMQIHDQQRLPQLTIAYLIDRSGSMGAAGSDQIPNIELAKKAIIDSLQYLQPTDRAAIASFDVQGYLIAPFQDVLDKQGLQRLVATLRAGGGTDILAGMRLIARDIVKEPSERKHIILLTDGGASDTGLVELAQQLYDEDGVTTSVIAIGQGAAPFLARMAEAGHGHYHVVTNPATIPAIFTSETVLASRSYIIEQPFLPEVTANSPILDGIRAMPQLQGYVATTPKVAAQVILRGPAPFSDPILAGWQYGLGRAVAFTSDATSRWATDWVSWDEFSRFWSQVVQWTITEASSNIETRVVADNERAHIVVDARDDSGAFLDSLNLQANLLMPDNTHVSIPLRQIAPGRYDATFTPQAEGAYFITVTGGGQVNGQTYDFHQVNGWVRSYSPEYNVGPTDDRLLQQMADLTGGGSLADDAEGVFAHNLAARSTNIPIWPWLLLAAALILPVDIAVRRLIITRSDMERLKAWMGGGKQAAESMSERIVALREARERARSRTAQEMADLPTIDRIGALKSHRDSLRAEHESEPVAVPMGTEAGPRYTRPKAPVAPSSAQEREEPGENVAERLLKRRKDRD